MWHTMVEDILYNHFRALESRSIMDPKTDLAPLTISKILWDAKLGCGILKTHEGSEAAEVRNLLQAHLDVSPALRIVIKADCIRYVVRAFLPNGRSSARVADLETHLKVVNPILRQHYFRCVHKLVNEKGTAFYFETTLEVVQWLRKRNCTAQVASRIVEFTVRPYFTTVSEQDEEEEDPLDDGLPARDSQPLQPHQLPHIPLPPLAVDPQ